MIIELSQRQIDCITKFLMAYTSEHPIKCYNVCDNCRYTGQCDTMMDHEYPHVHPAWAWWVNFAPVIDNSPNYGFSEKVEEILSS